MNDLHWLTARQIRRLVETGDVSCEEVARHHLDRIGRLDSALNSMLTITADTALEAARKLDSARSRREPLPPLAGVPAVLKDNIGLKGERMTCGSKILEGYVSSYDATVAERIKAAGAIVLGKANLDEFAMGSSTENSAFGPARNPWDPLRVPGGSSGGAAAAVAAGLSTLALGSDTGGSVKQPAAFCGLVGCKPTYGRTSRFGLTAFASSLDGVGPMSRTVEDNLLLLSVISGPDPRDSTCAELPPVSAERLEESVSGLRVGLPGEYFGAGLDAEVEAAVKGCARLLEAAGCQIEPISLPHTEYAVAVYYVVATAEASSNLGRFDGVRYGLRVPGPDLPTLYENTRGTGFGAEVKRRILLGTYVLSAGYYDAYYAKAQKARSLCREDFHKAFRRVDLILCPTTPTPAFPLGEKAGDPLAMYLSDAFTIPANLGGFPGLSFPCAFSRGGLPLGAQLIGPHGAERTLYRAGRFCESALGLTHRHPAGF